MSGGLPLGLEFSHCTAAALTSDSAGTVVNPGSSANTKGSYITLIAATAADACWALVSINNISNHPFVADIAVGGAGAEVVIANNLKGQSAAVARTIGHFYFPVSIPAGTRVSARTQSSGGSADNNELQLQIVLFDGSFTQMEGAAGVDEYGINLGTTLATQVTSNGSANVKGSYTQIAAATSRDYMGLMAAFGNAHAPAGSCGIALDIAIGAGGSENVIISNVTVFFTVAASAYLPAALSLFFTPILAGSRLSVRCQDTTGGNSIDVALYGVYQ
jgi:hypothetical protein